MNLEDITIETIWIRGVAYTKDGKEYEFNANSSKLSDETLESMFDDLDFALHETILDMDKYKTSECLTMRKISEAV